MRETRQSGSEGGGAHALPTPILVDYKSRYKRGTCTSRNVIRSLPLPVPYLSTHIAEHIAYAAPALQFVYRRLAAGRLRLPVLISFSDADVLIMQRSLL
jgi:hypothetical protein